MFMIQSQKTTRAPSARARAAPRGPSRAARAGELEAAIAELTDGEEATRAFLSWLRPQLRAVDETGMPLGAPRAPAPPPAAAPARGGVTDESLDDLIGGEGDGGAAAAAAVAAGDAGAPAAAAAKRPAPTDAPEGAGAGAGAPRKVMRSAIGSVSAGASAAASARPAGGAPSRLLATAVARSRESTTGRAGAVGDAPAASREAARAALAAAIGPPRARAASPLRSFTTRAAERGGVAAAQLAAAAAEAHASTAVASVGRAAAVASRVYVRPGFASAYCVRDWQLHMRMGCRYVRPDAAAVHAAAVHATAARAAAAGPGRGRGAVRGDTRVYVAGRGAHALGRGRGAGRGAGRGGAWTAPPPSRTRCKYWPDCTKPAGTCEYVHPSVDCKVYPECPYGAECLFVHPAHKAAIALTARAPRVAAAGGDAPVCKFGEKCDRITCAFRHPWRSAVAGAAVDTSALSASLPTTPPRAPEAAPAVPAAPAAAPAVTDAE